MTDSSSPAKTATKTLPLGVAGLYLDLRKGQISVYYDNLIQFPYSTEPVTWTLISGSLPPGLQMQPFSPGSVQLNFRGTPTQAGTFNFRVQAQDANNLTAQTDASINILPAALKNSDGVMQLGVVNQQFDHVVAISGGTPPYTFTLSNGALPGGLQLNGATGDISGTPLAAGYSQFNVTVTDTTTPTAFTLTKPYTILVTPAALPPRNDAIADATPIAPGTYTASLSPYTDDAGNPAPDHDYYVMTGNGGDRYQISVSPQYQLWLTATNPAPLTAPTDPALEIVDSSGTRLTTCNDPLADNPPSGATFQKGAGDFTDACVDHYGADYGLSSLTIKLPTGSSQSFYIHIFDFEGRARPDFIYSLTVTKQ